MKLNLIHFFLAWWLNNVGVLLYLFTCIWIGHGEFEIGTASILLFAALTKENYLPPNVLFVALNHFIVLFTFLFMYMYDSKLKIILIGCILLTIMPNHYNPYHHHLIYKLFIYTIVVWRIKKQSGLPISKYICF
jgi:hypothetical protein